MDLISVSVKLLLETTLNVRNPPSSEIIQIKQKPSSKPHRDHQQASNKVCDNNVFNANTIATFMNYIYEIEYTENGEANECICCYAKPGNSQSQMLRINDMWSIPYTLNHGPIVLVFVIKIIKIKKKIHRQFRRLCGNEQLQNRQLDDNNSMSAFAAIKYDNSISTSNTISWRFHLFESFFFSPDFFIFILVFRIAFHSQSKRLPMEYTKKIEDKWTFGAFHCHTRNHKILISYH